MTTAISVAHVTRRFGRQQALDDVSFDIGEGSIVGLLGRNGAGKTTLMRVLAAEEFASSGSVRVLGASPLENEAARRRMVFIREDQVYPDFGVRHALRAAALLCPNWSGELADALVRDFELPLRRPVKALSRGMRTMVGLVLGLASRSDLTMFDEPYAGLDAVSRRMFYDRLLADCAEHPRTVFLSTHLIDEAAGLFERVVVLNRGRVVLDAATDDLRGSATRVTGAATAVAEFAAGRPTWDQRVLGSQATVVVGGPLSAQETRRAQALHLDLEAVSLQQLVMHVASRSTAEQPEGAIS